VDADKAVLDMLDRAHHRGAAAVRLAMKQGTVQADSRGHRGEDEPPAEIGSDEVIRRHGLVPQPAGGGDSLGAGAGLGFALPHQGLGVNGKGGRRRVDQTAFLQRGLDGVAAASGKAFEVKAAAGQSQGQGRGGAAMHWAATPPR
jgi:hypothetical protein